MAVKQSRTSSVRNRVKRLRRHVTRKRLAIAGGLLAAFLILVPVATYAYYVRDINDRERLMNRNSTGIVLRDKHGEVFYEYGRLNGNNDTKLSDISDNFEKALLASEDRGFYKHDGYSIRGIGGAMYANFLNKDPTLYGGSTITQQLVKNNLLSADKSFLRKYQELAMSIAIERQYTKDEILEMYINSVYLGEGAFGITDAAQIYFGKSPQDLDVAESSMLVGILPAPTAYSPVSGDKERAKKQQQRVLNKLTEAGVITQEQKVAADQQVLAYKSAGPVKQKHAQHFATMVIEELKKKYGEETIIRSGYDVTTSLDLNWQRQAEDDARARVAALSRAKARNAGLVAIDPRTGQIRALVGSVDWDNPTFGKVNMTTSARQPGSSFKPIYYTEALDKRVITAATILEDKPKTYGGTYKPTNYDFKYRGNIPVRNALAQSLNIPSVDVMQKLGVDESAKAARRMGISTVTEPEKYGLSLALGTAEVKLYEMVNAYAAYANAGNQYSPTTFTAIKNKFNDKVYQSKPASAKRVTSAESSYLISSILSDNQARAATFGGSLNIGNRKVAVKTGTTNDSKDAWTIGYTPSVAVGVWMGNNENEPMVGLAGSSSAGGVWRSTMTKFLQNTPNEEFQKPSNVIKKAVCNGRGGEEFFIRNTEPKQDCTRRQQDNDNNDNRQDRDNQPEQRREQREEEPVERNENPNPPRPDDNQGNEGPGNNGGIDNGEVENPIPGGNPTGPGGRGGGNPAPNSNTP